MFKKRMICAAVMLALCLTGCGNAYNNTAPTEFAAYDTTAEGNTNAGANTGIAAKGVYETDANFADNTIYDYEDDNNIVVGQAVETPDNDNIRELPAAGQLTAGSWSDNENWGFFSNLISSGRLSYPLFGLDPTKRILVNVKTKDGKAVPNAAVELVTEKDEVIWKGVTDYMGRVYLINKNDNENIFVKMASSKEKQPVVLSQSHPNNRYDYEQAIIAAYSAQAEIVIDGKGEHYKNADIMFIIDSTGSMYDEMNFLQSEFTEITNRIGNENTRYSVNFYRDEGDDYLTKCSGFSSDVSEVQEILNNESAAGGKGQIAAVAQALDETMNADDWSDDSVKLAFLIFDAPPYKEAADSLAQSVETAAAKGIRLIPVVGSGSDSDVEMFGRAIAIETGGVYVFLTDDSGIGESHEEPIIGEHEVKPLVDIITDIIKEYRQ